MCFSHFQVQKADRDSEDIEESEKINAEHPNVSLTIICHVTDFFFPLQFQERDSFFMLTNISLYLNYQQKIYTVYFN